jgi:mono/diheme cytochrome c family protein
MARVTISIHAPRWFAPRGGGFSPGAVALALLALIPSWAGAAAPTTHPPEGLALVREYCGKCHNDDRLSAGLTFDDLRTEDLQNGERLGDWEGILRMTARGEMPPRDRPQPAPESRAAFTHWLEGALDARAAAHPDPGRATLRRLNRAEYANAVRDLLALDVDVTNDLPADDSGYGFDNIADVLTVTPTLMDRYLSVAGKISRLAVGKGSDKPFVTTFVVPKDGSILNQGIPSWDERASDALPLDSRGGAAFRYFAPRDGVYEISGWLNANTNNEVDRLPETRVSLRVPLTAGPHSVGITFRRQLALDEAVQVLHNDLDYVPMPVKPPTLLPLQFIVDAAPVGETRVPSYHLSRRFSQANWPRDVLQVDVEGPYDVRGPGNTPSRARIFSCHPSKPAAEQACAQRIVATLARQAWRRPVDAAEVAPLLKVYALAREGTDFEQGIEAAVEALLVSPSFLFVREQDPPGSTPGSTHALSDLEFASRLALFLWSSLPDEPLLTLASQGQLRRPEVLARQVDRMLGDPRARALTTNFAGQWLYLRNLDYHRPDVVLFPNFNTRLRDAMRQETELFFANIVRENRSVLEFIDSDYTFLNQRLAEHYGIDGVQGPAFRRVSLPPGSERGGLLGQASILTVTSYGNHTSVVKRGHWILTNLLAAPPPPPPPDIPALKTTLDGRVLSAREQLELHRADPACSSCHAKMDPLGYALESFDAIGVYRTQEAGRPLDVTATLPDGTEFRAPSGLRKVMMERKDEFTRAFTERLLTYALGRGTEAPDMPTVRGISRAAAQDDYRLRAIILGIVKSEPFNLRRTPES